MVRSPPLRSTRATHERMMVRSQARGTTSRAVPPCANVRSGGWNTASPCAPKRLPTRVEQEAIACQRLRDVVRGVDSLAPGLIGRTADRRAPASDLAGVAEQARG